MNWYSLTFFGDSMLLLPSGIIIFAILIFAYPTWKQTCQWVLLFGGVGGIVCASKLAFMGWGIGIRELDFTGFSGHSALSASIWPVMLWLLAGRYSANVRKIAVLCGYALALLIGYSRLAIHAHSVSEVVTGLALGFIVSSTFLWLQRNVPPPRLSYRKIAAALLLPVVLINNGTAAPTQGLLEFIAVSIAPIEKPFTREDLHLAAPVAYRPAGNAAR
ncbi:phosphatase PAP2 family protein [Serratia entomophila]|uniref:phosphatase PAP2 family protein n=1 Tax=Serratia entomophila TaxID=42906 RepID=UPI00217A1E00|nr:phosphatase PAP2 family protein [Serratia entomophila]CAI1119609.1 PAP2 superfamily [Serratia entomophila]CAI1834705.1 PAP2 superfamily [Serratia entomophila]CAI1852106.1 PAP2 superfamily [Serratia entomophila]CAI1900432.1 PAP2 superfamily [Serratia entomophila]CAI1932479.1 PAP2 superfamily [Serratia entomophila]